MWLIIVILLAGGFAGYLLRNVSGFNQKSEKITSILIYVLLFFMGLSVGINPEIMRNFGKLGLNALYVAGFTILGSVCFAWVFNKFFYNREK